MKDSNRALRRPRLRQVQTPETALASAPDDSTEDLVRALAGAIPRHRLLAAAQGRGALDRADVEAVLAQRVVDLDDHVSTLGRHLGELLEFLFSPQAKPTDPAMTLEIIERVQRLRTAESRELRKTADLLVRMASPRPQLVNIVAVKTESIR